MSKGSIKKLELESSKVIFSASQMYFDVLVGFRFKGDNDALLARGSKGNGNYWPKSE